MKFINDDEHIKTDFGYDRLNIRYNKCVKCRKCNAEQKIGKQKFKRSLKNKLKYMGIVYQIEIR